MLVESPMEQFEVVDIMRVTGTKNLSVTNVSVMMLISLLSIVGVERMVRGEEGGRMVGGRWSRGVEGMYKLVVGMVYESIGRLSGGGFIGKVLTLFVLVIVCNVVGLVPYSYTVTSQLVITLGLSLGVWVGKLLIGVRRHGIRLLGMFIPGGAPFGMVPFFVFVEVIGFIIPVISLAVRLFANMMSGHILLKVLFGFSWMMLVGGGVLSVLHVIPMSILFLLLGLETVVAGIQGYVLTLLTCIYVGDMVKGGH